MSTEDDRDPRILDLARAYADNVMVVRQRPGGDVERRITFPDGSIVEQLATEPPDGPADAAVIVHRWRVTEGENMAKQWVEAEQHSMERAAEHLRARIAKAPGEMPGLAGAGMPWLDAVRQNAEIRDALGRSGFDSSPEAEAAFMRWHWDRPLDAGHQLRAAMRPEEQQIADRQAAAPVVADPPADLAALLASIESEIVDAGERCCPDYQQLDWDVLTACYENVKRLVREFVERRLVAVAPGSPEC